MRPMVNLIETLVGLAIVTAVAALVSVVRRRRAGARKLGIAALSLAAAAAILELYLRADG